MKTISKRKIEEEEDFVAHLKATKVRKPDRSDDVSADLELADRRATALLKAHTTNKRPKAPDDEDEDYAERPIALVATAYEPQTAEKIEVMRGRVAAGFQPCRPGDSEKRADVERQARHLGNGAQDKTVEYRNIDKQLERPDAEEDARTEFLADLAAMRLGRKGNQ